MSDSRMDQTLLRVFREAFDDQEIPDDGHFVEDYHLLSRWSAGLLEPGEHERMIEHLAACPECREVIGVMLDTGAFDLAEVTEDSETEPDAAPGQRLAASAVPRASSAIADAASGIPPATSTVGRATRQWTVAGVVMALAALLLLSVTVWPPSGGDTRLGRSLALREFDYSLEGDLVWKSFLDEPPPLPPAEAARLQQFQQELENQPRDVRLNLEVGYWSLRAGDTAAAERAFEQVQRIEPGNTDAAIGMATARFQAGAYADAYERFRQLAASHPDDWQILISLGTSSVKLGRHEEANAYFRQAYPVAPAIVQEEIAAYLEAKSR